MNQTIATPLLLAFMEMEKQRRFLPLLGREIAQIGEQWTESGLLNARKAIRILEVSKEHSAKQKPKLPSAKKREWRRE